MITIINLWHDALKNIDYAVFGFLDGIARYFEGRGMYHDVRHIQTVRDKKRMDKWFKDFKKNLKVD